MRPRLSLWLELWYWLKAEAVAWDVTMDEALAATVAVALAEAVDMAGMCCRSWRRA